MGADSRKSQAGRTSQRRGRTWAVSLLGLYPLALGFLTFVAPHIARWPLPVRAAIFPLVLLTLMTYVVMPVLTRLTGRWLSGGEHAVVSLPCLAGTQTIDRKEAPRFFRSTQEHPDPAERATA
jgi:antibiotic biosynthesis monooxygenase (ABM) superfamily enzyme